MMAENTTGTNDSQQAAGADASQQGQGTQQKTKFTSVGEAQVVNRVSPSGQQKLPNQEFQNGTQSSQASATGDQSSASGSDAGDSGQQQSAAQVSQEQIEAALKQTFGDAYTGDLEALKKQIQKPVEQVQETDEQKKAKEQLIEQRMLNHFITKEGGDITRYANLQEIAKADLTQLSEITLKTELKANGFTDDEIAVLVKERYYQLDDAEIEAVDDEDEKNFLKKKKQAFGGRPTKKAELLQNQAKEKLNTLKAAIEAEDLSEAEEKQISSKIDEIFQKLPREVKLELGKVNDAEIAPIEHKYDEADIQAVVEQLKDPKQRKQIFLNDNNTINLESAAKLLLENRNLKNALRTVYLESASREVSKFESIFPNRTANDLGVRGNGSKQTGSGNKFVSAGEPQVVRK